MITILHRIRNLDQATLTTIFLFRFRLKSEVNGEASKFLNLKGKYNIVSSCDSQPLHAFYELTVILKSQHM